MKNMKVAIKLLKENWKTLFYFEVIYKLVSTVLFVPFFFFLFNRVMNISGYSYLTLENIPMFFQNPYVILALIVLILLIGMITFLDIASIIIILDYSYHKKKITVLETLKLSIRKSLHVLKITNILLIFLLLVILPLLQFNTASSFLSTFAIPEFILDFIKSNIPLLILFATLVILFEFLAISWIYAFHYFVLEDCSFRKSRKNSVRLIKNNRLKDMGTILLTQLLLFLFYLFILAIGIGIFYLLSKVNYLYDLARTLGVALFTFGIFFYFALSTPINYACVSALYYRHKERNQEKIPICSEVEINSDRKAVKRVRLAGRIVVILSIISCLSISYLIESKRINLDIEFVRNIEVTAHRGDSKDFPENTMSAFLGAVNKGADYIELDVQQSKDGVLFIAHDSNFSRVAGVSKYSWELTWNEIEKLDVGSFFSKKFKGEKVPTLEEAIIFARDHHIKLNIELKPTGHEKDFEKEVVDLLLKYNFTKDSVITSQTYQILENVKKVNKNIRTVYVMSIAYGNITKLDAADDFSIEASNVTNKLIKDIHNHGSHLYVWTVNTKENINKMIDYGVDNIITDDVLLVKSCIQKSKRSNLLNEYYKFLDNYFS